MAKLPEKSLKDRMDAVVHVSFPRPHFGGSVVGHPCKRYVLYSFRWAHKSRIESRLNRIFRLGDAVEDILVKELNNLGYEVKHAQARVGGYKGHAGGSIDGEVLIDSKHLFEAKSMKHSIFMEIQRKGCEEAKPQYYNQCQIYMGKRELLNTLFICMDKDTSELYIEIIGFDVFTYEMLLAKEEEVIDAVHINNFPRISQNPSWFQCKFCDAKAVCHTGIMPEKNCRTCEHVELHEDGKWACGHYGNWLSQEEQEAGCADWYINPLFTNEA